MLALGMQGLLFSPLIIGTDGRNPPPQFKVVTVHDDEVTARRAQKGLSVLADEFGPDCEFQPWRWRSDKLHDPHLQGVAARDVAEADFVLLAIRSHWPLKVGALVDAWLVEKQRRDVVLMAVFDDTNAREVGAGLPALARLAARQGLDFFEQVIGGPKGRHGRGLTLAWVL